MTRHRKSPSSPPGHGPAWTTRRFPSSSPHTVTGVSPVARRPPRRAVPAWLRPLNPRTILLWCALIAHPALEGALSTPALKEPTAGRHHAANPFFVLDNGLEDEAHRTLAAKAALIQELGYDGVGWRPGQIAAMRKELEPRGLAMFSLYVGARIGRGEQAYDPALADQLEELRGTAAFVWLFVSSKEDPPSSPAGDARAVSVIREIADLAARSDLRVALYPHQGNWLERIQDAVRLARLVDRPNVGVTFNLCHCLRVGDGARIPELLTEAKPHLFLVSINGADVDGKDWGSLIQTLDRGTFNLLPLLQALQRLDYTGPIGLQCYGINGDVRSNLTRSMQAWHKLQRELSAHPDPGGR